MSLTDFIQKSKTRYDNLGPKVLPSIFADFAMSAVSKSPVVPKLGTNIFSCDWDVLLILDACRYDMYCDLIRDSGSVWSVGSASDEWMQNTFTEEYREELSRTAYVTGNPFSEDNCSPDMFATLDELWRTNWDSELGTIHPERITDYTITRHRDGFDRVVAHYMQPHYPFIGSNSTSGGGMQWSIDEAEASQTSDLALWDQFLFGVRDDLSEVRSAYRNNLRHVWTEVETVLRNTEGKVVVTADHGNALGELGLWGHKSGFLHPKMRHVPWDEYECVDEETYHPEIEQDLERDHDRDEQLESLGYL